MLMLDSSILEDWTNIFKWQLDQRRQLYVSWRDNVRDLIGLQLKWRAQSRSSFRFEPESTKGEERKTKCEAHKEILSSHSFVQSAILKFLLILI